MYGLYNVASRELLWQDLIKIDMNIIAPWFTQGDFNAMLSDGDRMGGILVNQDVANVFHNCLPSLDLQEVHTSGPRFTWMP